MAAAAVAGAPGRGRPASVPLQPLPPPAALISGGARLDGRGLEEFRPPCEAPGGESGGKRGGAGRSAAPWRKPGPRRAAHLPRQQRRAQRRVRRVHAAAAAAHARPRPALRPLPPTYRPRHQGRQPRRGVGLRRVWQHKGHRRRVSGPCAAGRAGGGAARARQGAPGAARCGQLRLARDSWPPPRPAPAHRLPSTPHPRPRQVWPPPGGAQVRVHRHGPPQRGGVVHELCAPRARPAGAGALRAAARPPPPPLTATAAAALLLASSTRSTATSAPCPDSPPPTPPRRPLPTPGPQRAAEKELASCLAAALEPAVDLAKLPKSVVDVYVLVMEAGGSEAATAATAASLALADAGVEMFDLVAACSVVRREGGGWGLGGAWSAGLPGRRRLGDV
jgi:hypothetical protein